MRQTAFMISALLVTGSALLASSAALCAQTAKADPGAAKATQKVAPKPNRTWSDMEKMLSQRFSARSEAAQRNAWWNRDALVKQLGLSEKQRKAMDAVLEKGLAVSKDLRLTMAKSAHDRDQALLAGDWKKAREISAHLGATADKLQKQETEGKIGLLSVLDAKQFAQLAKEEPQLIARTFVHGRPMMRRGARPMGRSRGVGPIRQKAMAPEGRQTTSPH